MKFLNTSGCFETQSYVLTMISMFADLSLLKKYTKFNQIASCNKPSHYGTAGEHQMFCHEQNLLDVNMLNKVILKMEQD